MIIALDAGHGIETYPLTKSKGVPEMAEFEFNSAVAGYAKKNLQEAGFQVILTQPLQGNSNSLQQRLKISKNNKADFLISIHADYNSDPKPRGYWIFYWHENETAKQFCEHWLNQAQKNFTHPSRGMRAGNLNEWCNFFMNRETHKAGIPAVLIEHGFMSNKADLKLLKSDKFRKQAAQVLTDSIIKMFGRPKPEWRTEIGKHAINELTKAGYLNNPEQWKKDLLKPLPAWVVWEMFRRILKNNKVE
ncbi:N-acetylmuramoyl-L-alanine amidase [Clostridium sp. 'deep sea']|uniref:N-acetylmuramoyl-L-alanine amidase family protein n=1 Tax=Clostridium sp. 'deep sea' TaxID=2779445 RepID=UPI0018967C97|nr:N-acetylmuramoyl-L-alanine amidase [Clostridium sp. 'deep sea']QOR33926.1 N-acetylmuramoyl-L-alanine amidase [Clostridium sp. 'deep sea']